MTEMIFKRCQSLLLHQIHFDLIHTMNLFLTISMVALVHPTVARYYQGSMDRLTLSQIDAGISELSEINEMLDIELSRSSRDLIGWNRQFNAANQPKWTNPNSRKISTNQQLKFLIQSGKFETKEELLAVIRKFKQHQIREQQARRQKMLKKLGY